ncbi:DUF547 domain-containing protein [Francisella frigiditurris]|uniref:DUF547 domain-containing protein n=1 Tax=Francisella frigiditurris TaxID=1542390 RepID=A0A1J0KUK9_9GAMM|nr:DUF547 domain-containing protein [Francisella frigiditurris]APC97378.1 hypothetical protein KX01_744 [Francisella frigiditurris]
MRKYFVACILVFWTILGFSAQKSEEWKYWDHWDKDSKQVINFDPWQQFLNKYLVNIGDQTYVKYDQVSQEDQENLEKAIDDYSNLNILSYNSNQQLAYWINMYNMLTVDLILKNKGITSIRQIDPKWFGASTGVWDKPVIRIEGKDITLNDIEHRILRPIWQDPRIHATLNCASISCPNLSTQAFEGNIIDKQLYDAFSNFINSPKGVKVDGTGLLISKIFFWYHADFGSNKSMADYIYNYSKDPKVKEYVQKTHKINYQNYNWSLNIYKGD